MHYIGPFPHKAISGSEVVLMYFLPNLANLDFIHKSQKEGAHDKFFSKSAFSKYLQISKAFWLQFLLEFNKIFQLKALSSFYLEVCKAVISIFN